MLNLLNHSHLKGERHSGNFEPLNLKVHSDGGLVIFFKDIFAKPEIKNSVLMLVFTNDCFPVAPLIIDFLFLSFFLLKLAKDLQVIQIV